MKQINKYKRRLDFFRIVAILVALLGILIILIGIVKHQDAGIVFGVLFLPASYGIFYVLKPMVKNLSTDFKNDIVKKELEKRIPASIFETLGGVPSGMVEDSNLVVLHEGYFSEDLLTGNINDVVFTSADIHVQRIRYTDNGKEIKTTAYKGRFYEFDFPKEFNSNVLLLQPSQVHLSKEFKQVKLESIEFNSEFRIYSTNPEDAFYVLTPQLMEKLLILDEKYADKITFSFKSNHLYIAVKRYRDAFDVTHFGPITEKHVMRVIKEIENIIEFVEYLRLDNTLFKK